MNSIDYSEYSSRARDQIQTVKAGPLQNQYRSCMDICCLITFIVFIIGFAGIGIYVLSQAEFYNSIDFSIDDKDGGIAYVAQAFQKSAGIIVGMFVLSLVIAIAFLLLLKNFPGCMVYTMIVLIIILFVALIVLGIVYEIYGLSIGFGIALLILIIVLFCFRDKIKTGILLLKVAADFLTEKPSVYLAPFYPMLMGTIFFAFWVFTFLEIVFDKAIKDSKNPPQQSTSQNVFIFIWTFMFIFMTEFLYYVMTFLIATACADWYYSIDQNYYTTGIYRLNRYHIGSMTFGAILVTIITMLKRLVQQEGAQQAGEGNAIIACCLCLVACCLSCIQSLLKVLNHNSVIVMSITGQSYWDSAKTAIGIIFENFGLFYIVDFISDIVVFFGILATVGIPTLISIAILVNIQDTSKPGVPEQIGFTAVCVFFLSLLLAVLIISLVGQALSCVFIFYCFDKKFKSLGIYVPNTPAAIQEFHEHESGEGVGTAAHLKS